MGESGSTSLSALWPAMASQDIEHLDWSPELVCEHSQHDRLKRAHDGSAYVLVDIHCPYCSQSARLAFCQRWWQSSIRGVICAVCRADVSRSDMYSVVRWLR